MKEQPVPRHRIVNDIGIGLAGGPGHRMRDIRVYAENGSVQVWAEVAAAAHDEPHEALQYLTPVEAMAFAKAFERCAIQALKEIA